VILLLLFTITARDWHTVAVRCWALGKLSLGIFTGTVVGVGSVMAWVVVTTP
jgi:hypothetical protein